MNLVISARDGPELKQRWRQQVARQRRRRLARGLRPLAAISYLTRGPAADGLVDVRHLCFVVLCDKGQDDGSSLIRCAGYSATSVPWGLKIGGADHCKFEKDLAMTPGVAARGRRFDAANSDLLSLALGLDQTLERHSRFPHLPRRPQPRWPTLWAAFTPGAASQLNLAGPEFEANHPGTGAPTVASLSLTAAGLTLYPLAYASHAWRQILAIYADLTTVPKRQVITLEPNARNLRGYDGAIEFDLVGSRFAQSASSRRRTATHQRTTTVSAS